MNYLLPLLQENLEPPILWFSKILNFPVEIREEGGTFSQYIFVTMDIFEQTLFHLVFSINKRFHLKRLHFPSKLNCNY